jgi:hypothetical protein
MGNESTLVRDRALFRMFGQAFARRKECGTALCRRQVCAPDLADRCSHIYIAAVSASRTFAGILQLRIVANLAPLRVYILENVVHRSQDSDNPIPGRWPTVNLVHPKVPLPNPHRRPKLRELDNELWILAQL